MTANLCKLIGTNLEPNKLVIPDNLGQPCSHQMLGAPIENLVETAGRICYDSIGSQKTRNTVDYHQHIKDVNHLSVAEHVNLTFMLGDMGESENPFEYAAHFVNIPGTYVVPNSYSITVTTNLRVILEFDKYFENWMSGKIFQALKNALRRLAKVEAPIIFNHLNPSNEMSQSRILTPSLPEEIWASFWIGNVSRGLSHELVRHKFRTAVSQRSTRYVDESESDWALHPLMKKYWDEFQCSFETTHNKVYALNTSFNPTDVSISIMKSLYRDWTDFLEKKLIEDGVDKFTAKKQARGAARGLLGNALSTEMIFSASLAQWQRMIEMRASASADAEIRILFVEIFKQLQTRFPNFMGSFKLVPSPDGLGECVSQ